MGDMIGKWAAGLSYGPVLSQIDLYLLGTAPSLHPILTANHPSFHLVFNIATGQTGGFSPSARDVDLPFTQKDEPATLPRVEQLIIITEISPWCTIVKNERGVTLGDVCTAIYKDYTENYITDTEFSALPARVQDQIRRSAMAHQQQSQPGWFYTPSGGAPSRFRRFDWLRERTFFEGLRQQPGYVTSRLGFSAGNIFVMDLVQ